MASSSRRRIAVILAILVIIIVLLLLRCTPTKTTPPPREETPKTTAVESAPATPTPTASGTPQAPEVLTPATIQAPAEVGAGTVVEISWTGPSNDKDYLTIVRLTAADSDYDNYIFVQTGNPAKVTAPIEGGDYEIRYVTSRSKTVLGRAPIKVLATGATLQAPAEVAQDTPFNVEWTGPDNASDYVVVVAATAPDSASGNYAFTSRGKPAVIIAPPETFEGELRYITGQQHKILARRPIRIVGTSATLDAPAQAVAGSVLTIEWKGPANQADYVTVVAAGSADGQYGNYQRVGDQSPVKVTMPIEPGAAELRYMTGRGAKVLGRRPLTIIAAPIELDASETAAPGAKVSVTWTGPNNSGDYLTIVPKSTADGKFGKYTMSSQGSPLTLDAPADAGPAEIRYMSGQGGKVLARRAILIGP